MNILDMKHIKKSFDGKIVLQDIDLQISPVKSASLQNSSKTALLESGTVSQFDIDSV